MPARAAAAQVHVVEAGGAQRQQPHAALGERLHHVGGELVVHEGADGLEPSRQRTVSGVSRGSK
jgi:hypothetical protein